MGYQTVHRKHTKARRRAILTFELLLFVLIIAQFIGAWQKRSVVQGEIVTLRLEAEAFQKKNVELRQLISYLNSPAFVEEKARQDLGLQRPGERVVIVAPPSGPTIERATPAKSDTDANPVKWLRLITGVR